MRLATSDLYESGYFLCGGARLAEVIPDRSGASPKIVFTFEGDYGLEEMRKSYWNGNATVNLAEYRRSLEHLKDIMFRHIRGGTSARPDGLAGATAGNAGGTSPRLNGEQRRRNRNGQEIVPAHQAVG